MVTHNACKPPRGVGEASDTVDARHALVAFGVPVAPVSIVNRDAFSTALRAGLTACEADLKSKAAREMHALVADRGKGVDPMKKPSLKDSLAQKSDAMAGAAQPAPTQEAKSERLTDQRINTTLRIELEKLERLKIIAARKRIRVNDLLLEGVDNGVMMRVGPAEFSDFSLHWWGRCPSHLEPEMRQAGRLIRRRRMGPLIRNLRRVTDPLFRRAGISLDEEGSA